MRSDTEAPVILKTEGNPPRARVIGDIPSACLKKLFVLAHNPFAVPMPGTAVCRQRRVVTVCLIHESAHMNLFRAHGLNGWIGEPMAWIAGAACSSAAAAPPPGAVTPATKAFAEEFAT